MKKDFKDISKENVVMTMMDEKQKTLKGYEQEEQTRLDQTATEDLDNKQYESKSEETMAEMNFLSKNIEILEKEISAIKQVELDSVHKEVDFGSLVQTSLGNLMVCTAQEEFEVNGVKFVGVSMRSPVFIAMKGLKAGSSFDVNGATHKVLDLK